MREALEAALATIPADAPSRWSDALEEAASPNAPVIVGSTTRVSLSGGTWPGGSRRRYVPALLAMGAAGLAYGILARGAIRPAEPAPARPPAPPPPSAASPPPPLPRIVPVAEPAADPQAATPQRQAPPRPLRKRR
jgi:hypothetical protein